MADDGDNHDNRLVRAYNRMLQRVGEHGGDSGRGGLREALEAAKRRTVELGELTREEAERIADYLRRDVEDAAQYVASSDNDYATWLHMDLQLVENWLWDSFTTAADRSRVELLQFQQPRAGAELYQVGEVAGPGALSCTHCGALVTLPGTRPVPACPACRSGEFTRTVSGP